MANSDKLGMTKQRWISWMTLKLVIGNKNYSSWSMRPWLALRANDIPSDEIFFPFYTAHPEKHLWPQESADRAHARSISAEMHSGFAALRNECGMNLHRPVGAIELSADALANIARVQQIWIECRERFKASGPFLFGAFGAADAMFAPVVHRFRTYAIEVEPGARDYMATMVARSAFQEWTRAGLGETIIIDRFETV